MNILQSDKNAIKSIIGEYDENDNEKNKFIIISSVIAADKVELKATDKSSQSAESNIMNYGDYKLSVSYQCNESLKQLATQGYVFFKFTPVKVVKQGDDYTVVRDQDFNIDITEYDLAPALM